MFFKITKKKNLNLTDEELLERYRKNRDDAAYGVLYARYSHLVFGLCLKYLKDEELSRDAVNEIFEKIMKDLREKEIKFFKSWLYKVSQNYCLMYLRRNKAIMEPIREEDEKPETGFMDFSLAAHLKDEEESLMQIVRTAVEMLKNGQKKCVELFFWEGKSYREIADETGLSDKDVKSHLQNGKRNIKNFINEKITTSERETRH